ncbi:metallophosphoesterase [bacterium CPR1]|nr:metallophosphoesterase [bacterium CPR1]
MLVGLLSDTHGHFDPHLEQALQGCDELWHAGDFGGMELVWKLEALGIPLRGVYGNIDDQAVRRRFPRDLRFEVEGVRVLMTHILDARARKLLAADPPDLFCYGHSHLVDARQGRWLSINPGACGREGIHQVKTLVLLELAAGKVLGMKICELGQR